MKCKALVLLVLLFVAFTVSHAQDVEYGKPEELKGVTKIFVDTGVDMKNHERIIKEIENAKLNLTILDSADDAEVILQFKGDKNTKYTGSTTSPIIGTDSVRSTPTYKRINIGAGVVFIPKPNRVRILLSFSDEEKTVFEKKPATNFAKTFTKAYKKANGIK